MQFLSLHVTVPAPRLHTINAPSMFVYTADHLNLTCTTVLEPVVDTPVIVTHSWQGPSGSISPYSSHSTVYNVTRIGQVYESTVIFSSGVKASDGGSYYCTANISSNSSSSYIVSSDSVLASTNISVGKWSFVYFVIRCECILSIEQAFTTVQKQFY